MKAIILAGGLGTRISEETDTKPKPMVLLDDKPIIWHLMNSFAKQGVTDFVIATGYKGQVLHDWVKTLNTNWNIKPLDTGADTMTGGRIRMCLDFIGEEKVFATYGDGLANVNLKQLLDFHNHQGRIATVTAVRPPARFGVLESENGLVTHFGEKNQVSAGWINGGYFVLQSTILKYLERDDVPFETGALPSLVEDQELSSFHHTGFWKPMDTLREKNEFSSLLIENKSPWLDI